MRGTNSSSTKHEHIISSWIGYTHTNCDPVIVSIPFLFFSALFMLQFQCIRNNLKQKLCAMRLCSCHFQQPEHNLLSVEKVREREMQVLPKNQSSYLVFNSCSTKCKVVLYMALMQMACLHVFHAVIFLLSHHHV